MGKAARGRGAPSGRGRPSSAAPRGGDGVPQTHNFHADAGPGCHIAHTGAEEWLLGSERYRAADYERGAVLPDLALDASSGSLSCVNTTSKARVFYVSTAHPCFDSNGNALAAGTWRSSSEAPAKACTTFVLSLPPRTLFHVCFIQLPAEGPADLHSDVQELRVHPSPQAHDPAHSYGFPLGGEGSYLCTQGEGGELSHFLAETRHAIDFRCPVGTPLLALAPGIIHELRLGSSCTGCHVSNLFNWQSVMVAHDDGTFAEYVHISSALVKAGERVRAGQLIAHSGEVGFAPEPHLHLQLHASSEPTAPTLRFALRGKAGSYFPQAGRFYSADGEVLTS
jgi:Peptidase family M23